MIIPKKLHQVSHLPLGTHDQQGTRIEIEGKGSWCFFPGFQNKQRVHPKNTFDGAKFVRFFLSAPWLVRVTGTAMEYRFESGMMEDINLKLPMDTSLSVIADRMFGADFECDINSMCCMTTPYSHH